MLTYSSLTLILPIAIMLHVTEEFLYPGGFIQWYNEFRPHKNGEDRPDFLVWINTLMIGVCVIPAYLGNNSHGKEVWFSIASFAVVNAGFHVWGVISLKKYSPGVLTAIFLYIPAFIFGCCYMVSSGTLSWSKILLYPGIAVGYNIFSIIRQGK